ncbi:MAG: polysaccharide biosynthesis tyrosine autokinase [Tepidisphaeraceae bacterium]
MTTLPQTTTHRLPRPVGGSVATNGAMAAPHHPAPAQGMSAADVWRVVRANLWIILGSFVVSCVAGYLLNLYLLKYHAQFTAKGLVAVQPPSIFDPMSRQNQTLQDWTLQIEQRTQTQVMTNEALLSKVLLNPNSAIRTQTEWFKKFMIQEKQPDGSVRSQPDIASAKLDLMDRLAATPIPDSKLIVVTMSCSNPKDCKTIIENIVNQHLEEQQNVNTDRQQQRTQVLTNLKLKYENRQRELLDRQNNRAMQLNIGSVGTPGRYTTTDIEMQSSVNKQIELATSASAAKATYESIAGQLANGQDPPTVKEMVERDPQVMSYRDRIVGLNIQLKTAYTQGKDNRTIKEMTIMRDEYQQELNKIIEEQTVQARSALLAAVEGNAKSSQEALDTCNKKIEQLKGVLGDLAIAMSDYLSISTELDTTRGGLKEIKDQLDTLASAAAQNSVYWAQKPEKPDSPSFPRLVFTLPIVVMLGLLISVGVAFLREMLDTSVRSPRDIARVGQMNLLGMIPDDADDPQSSGATLPLVIFQAPTSMMAEQYRQVRSRLQHAASMETTRSMLVTSPGPADGKTTVACNLGAGLALNGRKILLVDANFRRPELAKIFGLTNDNGFSNVLASIDNFEGAVRSTQVPNLDVLTTGPKPANPTELLESQLLIDFIERALEDYDHVIFDSGPLLFVSETAALAPRVDGVVTVVRARTNSRGLLQRLRDGLRQLKAEHLGVVLNAVRAQGGGYYGRNIKTYYEYANNGDAT